MDEDLLTRLLLQGMPCNHEHGGQSDHIACTRARKTQATNTARAILQSRGES